MNKDNNDSMETPFYGGIVVLELRDEDIETLKGIIVDGSFPPSHQMPNRMHKWALKEAIRRMRNTYSPTLEDSLDNLRQALADVVCHPDLSDDTKIFLADFCKIISEKASESVKGEKA